MKPPGYPDLISRHRFVEAGDGGAARHGVVRLRARSARSRSAPTTVRTWQPAVLEPPVSAVRLDTVAVHLARPPAASTSCRVAATDVTGNVQPLRPIWNIQGMAQNGVERTGVRVV